MPSRGLKLTALHIAAEWGHSALIELCRAAHPWSQYKRARGRITPLHCACATGRADAVRALLDWNEGAALDKSDDGWTPTFYNAMNGSARAL